MADRFLHEVKRMHQLRQDINEMTPEEVDELIRGLGDDAAEDWVFAARDAQLPPPDLSWCWSLLHREAPGCFGAFRLQRTFGMLPGGRVDQQRITETVWRRT